MRVLFDTNLPFAFAHGGVQLACEATERALRSIGVATGHVAWWDTAVSGDLVHYFGRPSPRYVDFAHAMGLRVVFTDLLAGMAARSPGALALQKAAMGLARRCVPAGMLVRMGWDSYQKADACLPVTEWEAHLMVRVLNAPQDRVHVVPNGVGTEFTPDVAVARRDELVCVATLRPLKRVVELAEAAVLAGVPVRFIGKPYVTDDSYVQHFMDLVAAHEDVVYEGAMDHRKDLAQAYRRARGFVLVSTMESYSLASAEAAACGCPLLLSDLPWARSVYADHARYCPVHARPRVLARHLRAFYDEAPAIACPPSPLTWTDVAHRLEKIYASVLSAPSGHAHT